MALGSILPPRGTPGTPLTPSTLKMYKINSFFAFSKGDPLPEAPPGLPQTPPPILKNYKIKP